MNVNFHLKRIIAMVLATVLLLQVAPVVPVVYASGDQHSALGEAVIDCTSDVDYQWNDTTQEHEYTLTLDIDAEYYDHKINTDKSVPARGYYTVHYDGWYLVELWGGDGAAGPGDGGRAGGAGGAGGYVYAKVWLEAGQTLYYSLGGDGSYTASNNAGGGANGGGNSGNNVTYGVGTGGGYSALFLFPEDTFEGVYTDGAGNLIGDNISEHDRNTKYLMIAGGGGGGGAAEGASVNSSGARTADGGAGGHVEESLTWEIADGLVAGTCYGGFDGKHTGSSDEYVGRGGTYNVGAVAGTTWDWYSGETPNNWIGTVNPALPGGSGGAGNLRGGSGGGGFCGGSGGVQQSLVSATQVGGGGGGSSFIAKTANNQSVSTDLSSEEDIIRDKVNNETGCTGGRVAITYLVQDHQDDSFEKTENLDVSFTVSPYFDLEDLRFTGMAVDGEKRPTYEDVSYDTATQKMTLKGVSLAPTEDNLTGDLIVTLKLTPKAYFPGGNDVPLLVGDKVTVTHAGVNNPVAGTSTCDIELAPNYCYVNVPLKLGLDVKNETHTSSGEQDWYVNVYPQKLYAKADHQNNQAKVGVDQMFVFITAINDCVVKNGSTGLAVTTETVQVSETTVFPISFDVAMTNNASISPVAGPENPATVTVSAEAIVTILSPHDGYIKGQKMKFVKELDYDKNAGTYNFSLQTSANNSVTSERPVYSYDPSNGTVGTSQLIEHAGVYLIQVWGGSGQAGQNQRGWLSGWFGVEAKGGAGGSGGYSYVYLKLNAGDTLIVDQMGLKSNQESSDVGGYGGTYTAVSVQRKDSINKELLVIAGGGGGGGDAVVGGAGSGFRYADGTNGLSADSAPTSALQNPLGTYNGGSGGTGDSSANVGGTGGSAGGNYYNGTYKIAYDASMFPAHDHDGNDETPLKSFSETEFNNYLSANSNPSTVEGGGAMRASCMWLDHHEHANMQDYTLQLQFSPFFTVEKVNGSYVTGKNNVLDQDALTYYTVDFNESTHMLTVSGINPVLDSVEQPGADGQDPTHYIQMDFTINMVLKPMDEFLGGNNVPVLHYDRPDSLLPKGARLSLDPEDTTGEYWANIGTLERTDFANVPLRENLITLNTEGLTGENVVIAPNDPNKVVSRSQLYDWPHKWSAPTDSTAWTAEFVEPVEIISEYQHDQVTEVVDVGWTEKEHTTNAHYDVYLGVGPKTEAKEGIVGPAAEPYLLDPVRGNVYVQHRMLYQLTGLDPSHEEGPDHCESMNSSETFTVTLVPQSGYALPSASGVAIYYCDVNGNYSVENKVPFAYDSGTGKITISPSAITRSMVLVANGVKQKYNIYFGYEVPGSPDPVVHSVTLEYDEALGDRPEQWMQQFKPAVVAGYDFEWSWRTGMDTPSTADDGKIPTTMPAYNVWVIGEYAPKTYNITVKYEVPNHDPVADGSLNAVAFGSDFSITSPSVPGYHAAFPRIRGTLDENLLNGIVDSEIYPTNKPTVVVVGSNITFTVPYTATVNQLRVEYEYEDTGVVVVHTQQCPTAGQYEYELETKAGYSLHLWDGSKYGEAIEEISQNLTISGTMDADGEVIKVLYRPRTYTVTLELGEGGQCTGPTTRIVTFNSTYEFHVKDGVVVNDEPLPSQASRPGYEFMGWYLKNTDKRIIAASTVDTPSDHVLEARWEAKAYTLEVIHVHSDGKTQIAETETYQIAYDQPYGTYCKPKTVEGYIAKVWSNTANAYVLAKDNPVPNDARMPGHSVVYTFTYFGVESKLTIEYLFTDDTKAADPYTGTYAYGATYSVKSPVVKDVEGNPYVCSQVEVNGIMGMSDETITVYYYTTAPVLRFTIEWGNGNDASTMKYRYDWGKWNPEKHVYEHPSIDPVEPDANTNRVRVFNWVGDAETGKGSTLGDGVDAPPLNIDATLSYVSNGTYPIDGYFTNSQAKDGTRIAALPGILPGLENVQSAWLWLTGSLPTTISGELPVGKCIVSISAAGGGS